MILTCPNCGTQYVVKDGAIPPEGRQVRCAACKHSWHQDPGEETSKPEIETAPERQTEQVAEAASSAAADVSEGTDQAAPENESFAEATLIEPRSGPEAEERAYDEAVIEGGSGEAPQPATESLAPPEQESAEAAPVQEDWNEPPHAEAAPDVLSPFPSPDEEPSRRSPLTTAVFIILTIIILAALFWFLAPAELKARLGLAAAGSSPLALVYTHSDRQKLESGNELLTVSGRVVNPTTKEQTVPPLEAHLTNRGGKVVYSWTIAPPARTLAAGASASFNSAEVNVPPGGEYLTITVGGSKTS